MAENSDNGHKRTFFKTKTAVCEHYGWTGGEFRLFINLGMPHMKINGRYMAHQENIEAWLKNMTAKRNKIEIDENNLPEA